MKYRGGNNFSLISHRIPRLVYSDLFIYLLLITENKQQYDTFNSYYKIAH